MRKLILSILIVSAAFIPAIAQHARFLGVEINGSQEQFKQQFLQVEGIVCLDNLCDQTAYVYSGSYAGVDNCTFYVFHQNGIVCSVITMLPQSDSWAHLKSQFYQFRDDLQFDATYRRIIDDHSFSAPYAEGDGDELIAIEAGKCKYRAGFENDLMSVYVYIDKRKCVCISIFDKQNFHSDQQQQLHGSNPNPNESQANDPSGQYLQFMGINIAGRPSDFAARLVDERGLTFHSRTSSGDIILTGSYHGIDGCSFGILVKDGNISSVGVNLPTQSTWDELRSRYTSLKTELRNQYTVISCTESFQAPFAEGDGDEFQAVVANKCTFRTVFAADHGRISLAIHKQGRVCILFKVD
ncbi:MAG: hypothetical protein ACI4AM_01370 [Muribaculaceae bacterium]